MKKLPWLEINSMTLIVLLLAALVAVPVILYTGSTEYGDCVGLLDQQDTSLVYEVPVGNLIVGTIFIETVVVPVVIVGKELWCPVAHRDSTP